MKYITIIILLLTSIFSKAQHCGSAAVILQYNTPKLIADETYITYTKTGAFIVTYSESVFNELCGRFINKFTQIKYRCKLLGIKWRNKYKIYLSTENGIMISNWSKSHL